MYVLEKAAGFPDFRNVPLPIYDANSGFMAEKQIRNFRRPIRISGSISAGRNITKKILSGAKNSAHASGCLGLMSKLI